MVAVIDANIFIHASSRSLPFDAMMTVPGVTEELESFEAQQRFESHDIELRSPEDTTVQRIQDQADEAGLSVSRTDTRLLALAADVEGTLITDDYQLQNLATQCGIAFQGFVRDEIEEATAWTRRCPNCGKQRDSDRCPVCGIETERVSSE